MTQAPSQAIFGVVKPPSVLSPIRQQRLLSSLNGVRAARVATIWAPVGYGKHRLVEDWLASDSRLHPIPVEVHDTAELVRERIDQAPSGSWPIVLVQSNQVTVNSSLLRELLSLTAAQQTRLVVASKIRPEFPVGTLATRGELVQLDAENLKYRIDDLVGLSVAASIPGTKNGTHSWTITDEQARRLIVRTDGWPTLVELIVNHLEDVDDPDTWSQNTLTPDELAPTSPQPYQPLLNARTFDWAQSYIQERVLDPLDADDRDLLEQLSMLPVVDPASAAALTQRPGAAAQLSRLQANGVPITWTPTNKISLNPALRSQLQQHLLVHQPHRRGELAEQAISWLMSRGDLLEAVRIATELCESALAQKIAIELVLSGLHRQSLATELPRLHRLIGGTATGQLILAAVEARPHTLTTLPAMAEWARASYRDHVSNIGPVALALNLWRRSGYDQMIDLTDLLALAATIDDHDLTELNRAQVATLLCEYGLYQMQCDHYQTGSEYLARAQGLAQLANAPWINVLSMGTLALVRSTYGRFAAAQELANEAIALTASIDFDHTALQTPARLAEVLFKLDDQSPMTMMDTIRPLMAEPGRLLEYEGTLAALVGLGMVSVGEWQAAARNVSAFRMSYTAPLFDVQRLLLCAVTIAAQLAGGDTAGAARELDTLRGLRLDSNALWGTVFESHVTIMLGDLQGAYETLRPFALRDEEVTSRAQLSVLQAFASVAALVGDATDAEQAATRGRLLAERLGVGWEGSKYPMSSPPSQQPTLTAAERKVLGNLRPGETLEDTAARMFVSTNTVKTHLRRIYRKLGVHDREAAVRRARALGIHSF